MLCCAALCCGYLVECGLGVGECERGIPEALEAEGLHHLAEAPRRQQHVSRRDLHLLEEDVRRRHASEPYPPHATRPSSAED